MRKLASASLVLLLVVPSCSRTFSPPAQTLVVAESYKVLQIAVESAVKQPGIDPKAKEVMKRLDREIMTALHQMRDAAAAGDGDLVSFYSGVVAGLLQQLRPYIEEGLVEVDP